LLKNLQCKKYIQCSENFQGKLCFSGQAQVAQKSSTVIYLELGMFMQQSHCIAFLHCIKFSTLWILLSSLFNDLHAFFIRMATIFRQNIVQYCACYNQSIWIRCNTYRHTGTCILNACFLSRGAIFNRSWPHERADCLAPLSALCASLSALLRRTATITQAGVGSQTLRPGTVACNHCVAPSKSRTYLYQ